MAKSAKKVATKGLKKGAQRKPPRDWSDDYQPKTELGRELLEVRRKIVASGEKLLNWKELEKEIQSRR